MAERKKFGEILTASGIVSEKTVQRALLKAKGKNLKIGQMLEEMGVVTADEVADALATQSGLRRVTNIAQHGFPPSLLQLIPEDTAMRHLLFPLKRDGGQLFIAMADPAETRIIANIAENHSVKVVPVVASRPDILAAISRHYLGREKGIEKKKTVLVAEDNPLASSELNQILTGKGYRVVGAKDGIEAFKLAIAEAPDVIITDKEMPNFSGYRLLESIRSLPETKNIPVILLTASSNSEEEAEAFRKGFFDFMTKPAKEVTLVTRVQRAVQAYEEACR